MFDEYARSLFTDFPEFEESLADSATRALSQAYLAVIEHRINGSVADVEQMAEVQPFPHRLANTLIFHVVLNEQRDTAERKAAGSSRQKPLPCSAESIAAENARRLEVFLGGR